jgi:hypothetical protein
VTTETFEADLRQALASGAADVPETRVDRLREAVLEESDSRLAGVQTSYGSGQGGQPSQELVLSSTMTLWIP